MLPVVIVGAGTIVLIRLFFAEDDGGLEDGVDWEVWGKAGLWLLAIVGFGALWLVRG